MRVYKLLLGEYLVFVRKTRCEPCIALYIENVALFFPRKLPFSITFPIFFQINRPPSQLAVTSRNVNSKRGRLRSMIVKKKNALTITL